MIKTEMINDKIRALFDCFDDSMIFSCFEGIYGELWCDDVNEPETAVIVSGDFHYLAGEPAFADEIMGFAEEKPHAVFVPSCGGWFGLLNDACGGRLKKVERYHMRLGQNGFDRQALSEIVDNMKHLKLSDCELCPIGREEYDECIVSDWADSFVSNFSDWNEYQQHGFGFVIKHGGRVVSGTSTYCYYSRGVEVEVSTAPEYRKNGLARITAARFIIECLDRDTAPNWDARNMFSVSIARKLGFELHDTYTAYEFKETEPQALLPKDKSDTDAVEKLSKLEDEQLSPIVPQLLEWIQDMNWQVAPLVCELLSQHYRIVEPHLLSLLGAEQTDEIWKYNIIKSLLGGRYGCPNDERLMSEIKRIAQHPTDSEKAELVDEAAKEYIEDPA